MWIDRLSAHPTPSTTPPTRTPSYSPAPRRPYLDPRAQHERPGLPSRSSSLRSLASGVESRTASSTNLPTQGRLGSSLRNQLENVADPLQVLHTILDSSPRRGRIGRKGSTLLKEKPANLVDDIDFDGLSLQAFAGDGSREQLKSARVDSYVAQSSEECTCRALPAHA